jgi:hypothetical protein
MLARPGRPEAGTESQGAPAPSFGLRWLWQYLQDIPRPYVLDCGPIRSATLNILLKRSGRLYRGDLISCLKRSDLWDRTRKTPVFRTELLLAELPAVPPASLSLVLCWHLLDLVPREALADMLLCIHKLMEPGGVLFCLLREPRLDKGADADWVLEDLTGLVRAHGGGTVFPYPALSNREIDRLLPTGSVKTFLTRSGWREVLVVK